MCWGGEVEKLKIKFWSKKNLTEMISHSTSPYYVFSVMIYITSGLFGNLVSTAFDKYFHLLHVFRCSLTNNHGISMNSTNTLMLPLGNVWIFINVCSQHCGKEPKHWGQTTWVHDLVTAKIWDACNRVPLHGIHILVEFPDTVHQGWSGDQWNAAQMQKKLHFSKSG